MKNKTHTYFPLLLLAAFFFHFTVADAARMETIAAVVNDDVISASDVEERMKLIMVSSGMPDNEEIRERLRPQVVSSLVEDRLKLQAAAENEISVSPSDIETGFVSIARQNRMPVDEFKALISSQGISLKTMEDQIRAQVAWSTLIQETLRSDIFISEQEVDERLERLRSNIGKTEYLVSEIFLPVESPEEESDVRALASRLTGQLLEGRVPFTRVAGQFSQSAGAQRGGDMGWVQGGQLAEELNTALVEMEPGDLSQPLRSLSGYHILYLREKREITEESIPSRQQIKTGLGNERLDRAQRRYLLDLKTAAFIERRA